jgi:hypothetical protein
MSSEQTIRVLMDDDTLGIPVFKEVPVLQSQERKWTEEEKEFQKKQLLYVIGLILIVILFIYVAVSGGILQVIKVIIGTIVLTPIIFFIWVFIMSGENATGAAVAIIFVPSVAVFTSAILTIIMAIYIFISNFTTPTPSTIV